MTGKSHHVCAGGEVAETNYSHDEGTITLKLRMTEERFQKRHRDRYARIMRREMTLSEALAEHDRDWQAMKRGG